MTRNAWALLGVLFAMLLVAAVSRTADAMPHDDSQSGAMFIVLTCDTQPAGAAYVVDGEVVGVADHRMVHNTLIFIQLLTDALTAGHQAGRTGVSIPQLQSMEWTRCASGHP